MSALRRIPAHVRYPSTLTGIDYRLAVTFRPYSCHLLALLARHIYPRRRIAFERHRNSEIEVFTATADSHFVLTKRKTRHMAGSNGQKSSNAKQSAPIMATAGEIRRVIHNKRGQNKSPLGEPSGL